MNFNLKNNKGITLVALVVTIIVLLILAAVSLSLVAGSDGLLNRASNAVDKTTEAEIIEDIELAVAQLKTDYYYEKYISNPTISGKFATYLAGKLGEGVTTAKGTIELEGTTVTYTNTKTNVETEGTFDSTTGIITILGRTIGTAESTNSGANPGNEDPGEEPVATGTPVLEAITDNTYYGDYFDLGTNLLDKTNVKLEGNETMLADWRIFSKDSTGVWLILADYLPVNGSEMNTFITGTGENQIGLVTKTGGDLTTYPYAVWSNTSRADLLDRLALNSTYSANWKGLLPSGLQSNSNITAVGALTVSEWQAGWNSKYTSSGDQITVSGDETNGYSNTNINFKAGYSNTLYFPHKSVQSNCYGYWLASPYASDTDRVMLVNYYGNVYSSSYYGNACGVRPAVHLASGINIEQNSTTGIWTISN